MNRRLPLVALAGAQFVMVLDQLDQSVMNVSISALVAEFDTTVGTIQAVITLYCLVMAMFMLTGGKIGDIVGRRRAFVIGLVIYACGSGLTAVSQTVSQLAIGWSILEGIGAALVLPAMVALIGAFVLVGLTGSFVTNVQQDARIADEVVVQIEAAAGPGIDFVASSEVEAALVAAGVDEPTTQAVVEDYEAAQFRSLKAGLLAAALIAFASLAFTKDLPSSIGGPEEAASC